MSNFVTGILNNLGFIKVTRDGGGWFYSLGDSPSDFWGEQSYKKYLKYYIEVPELHALINYAARAESKVKIKVINRQSGEEVEDHPIAVLLNQPNWMQSRVEFLMQSSIFRQITGNEYLYILRPIGMDDNYKALYTLPPQTVYVTTQTEKFFLESNIPKDVKYYFKSDPDKREYEELRSANILHLTDNRVNFTIDKHRENIKDRKNYLYGTSPLASVIPELETLRLIHEGRYSLRDVAAGVISPDVKDVTGPVNLKPEEKEELQRDAQKYSIAKKKFQHIFSKKGLRYNSLIPRIGDLQIYEETREAVQSLCANIGVPIEAVGRDVTYENKKQADRMMYENVIIPRSNERIGALNKFFKTQEKGIEIIGSFEHLSIFQENMKERGQALNLMVTALDKALSSQAITLDEYQRELRKFGIGDDN